MPFEDIEIRITKDGKIYVKLDGVTEERVLDYHRFLEENVGPVLESQVIRKPDWDHPASIAGETAEDAKRREQELRRY